MHIYIINKYYIYRHRSITLYFSFQLSAQKEQFILRKRCESDSFLLISDSCSWINLALSTVLLYLYNPISLPLVAYYTISSFIKKIRILKICSSLFGLFLPLKLIVFFNFSCQFHSVKAARHSTILVVYTSTYPRQTQQLWVAG